MRCTSCGHEFVGGYDQACPSCGTVVRDPFASSSTPWQPPTVDPRPPNEAYDVQGDGLPWEVEQTVGTLFETLRLVLLEPSRAFSMAGVARGLGPALAYALILGIVGGLVSTLTAMGVADVGLEALIPAEYQSTVGELFQPQLFQVIAIPVTVVFAAFITSGICHLGLMVGGGAHSGFEATFRGVAFASGSVALFQIVPFMGDLVAFVWSLVIMTIAFTHLHRTTTGVAILGAMAPLIIGCVCGGVALAAGMALGVGMMGL